MTDLGHLNFSHLDASLVTDKCLLLGVLLSDVFLEVGVLGEPQAAPATDVGLHALVEQLVAGQVVLVFELLMTDLSYRADQSEYRGF